MVDDRRRPLRDDELARIASAIDPRARGTSSGPILGGLDAATYRFDLHLENERRELVVRIFTLPEHRDGAAARRYWNAITGIPLAAPVPIPRPVLLDAEGRLVGLPCVVTTRLPGTILAPPADDASWIDELARTLAAIHAVDVSRLPADFVRGPTPVAAAESRLSWFRPPAADRLWDEVDAALRSAAPAVTLNTPVLTHHDFWFGNTLWSGGRVTGVVDWGEARIDDPAFDVGYARLDVHLTLGGTAADRFLGRYEARRGPLRSLPFWDLTSSLPGFRWLADWVTGYREVGRSDLSDEIARERLESFVRAALSAL